MKKLAGWMKAHWGIAVIVWAAIIAAIFIFGNMALGDRIQAASVITLVFITWFYAFQTQRLVDEDMKRRNAEFGMQRIEKFLRIFLQHLESLRDNVSQVAELGKHPCNFSFKDSLGIYQARMNEFKNFFIEHLFLTDPIIRYGYLKIIKMPMPKTPKSQSEEYLAREYIAEWKASIDENIDQLTTAVNNEISRICQDIRKTYGLFSHEMETLGSSDDLTVLSDRPPMRV
jgi:hypothetical protein